jgi:hypothetical protein
MGMNHERAPRACGGHHYTVPPTDEGGTRQIEHERRGRRWRVIIHAANVRYLLNYGALHYHHGAVYSIALVTLRLPPVYVASLFASEAISNAELAPPAVSHKSLSTSFMEEMFSLAMILVAIHFYASQFKSEGGPQSLRTRSALTNMRVETVGDSVPHSIANVRRVKSLARFNPA